MASFEELLNSAKNPGDDGPSETIYDDLGAAYNDRVSAGDAKVAELSGTVDASTKEIERLKAHNYDLLSAIQQGNSSDVRNKVNDANEGEAESDIVSLDDIITYS